MYTGPNVTNDDLVFGYDTGYSVADNTTATRFYPGEPTTNVLTTGTHRLLQVGAFLIQVVQPALEHF